MQLTPRIYIGRCNSTAAKCGSVTKVCFHLGYCMLEENCCSAWSNLCFFRAIHICDIMCLTFEFALGSSFDPNPA